MLIILEGPDLAGKSTFARQLCDTLMDQGREVTMLHKGPLTEHPLVEYEHDLRWYEPTDVDKAVICDRWHIGETIYGPILRGHSRLDIGMKWHVDMWLRRLGAVVIHVNVENEVLNERFDSRGDDLVKREQLCKVQEEYFRHFEKQSPCFMVNGNADVNDPEYPTMIELITSHARDHEAKRLIMTDVHETYVGSPEPQTLFLGDRRHNDDHRYRSAFMPFENTSGHWLCRCLYIVDPFAEDTGLMNACEDPQATLRSWSLLGEPHVIALGKNASRTCKEIGIPHGAVPHPQFMRRFHHRAWLEYIEALRIANHYEEDLLSWRP